MAQCYMCGKVTDQRCSRCHEVWYCGREHQLQHWATHKHLCYFIDSKFDLFNASDDELHDANIQMMQVDDLQIHYKLLNLNVIWHDNEDPFVINQLYDFLGNNDNSNDNSNNIFHTSNDNSNDTLHTSNDNSNDTFHTDNQNNISNDHTVHTSNGNHNSNDDTFHTGNENNVSNDHTFHTGNRNHNSNNNSNNTVHNTNNSVEIAWSIEEDDTRKLKKMSTIALWRNRIGYSMTCLADQKNEMNQIPKYEANKCYFCGLHNHKAEDCEEFHQQHKDGDSVLKWFHMCKEMMHIKDKNEILFWGLAPNNIDNEHKSDTNNNDNAIIYENNKNKQMAIESCEFDHIGCTQNELVVSYKLKYDLYLGDIIATPYVKMRTSRYDSVWIDLSKGIDSEEAIAATKLMWFKERRLFSQYYVYIDDESRRIPLWNTIWLNNEEFKQANNYWYHKMTQMQRIFEHKQVKRAEIETDLTKLRNGFSFETIIDRSCKDTSMHNIRAINMNDISHDDDIKVSVSSYITYLLDALIWGSQQRVQQLVADKKNTKLFGVQKVQLPWIYVNADLYARRCALPHCPELPAKQMFYNDG